MVQDGAVVCRYCGHSLAAVGHESSAPRTSPKAVRTGADPLIGILGLVGAGGVVLGGLLPFVSGSDYKLVDLDNRFVIQLASVLAWWAPAIVAGIAGGIALQKPSRLATGLLIGAGALAVAAILSQWLYVIDFDDSLGPGALVSMAAAGLITAAGIVALTRRT